MKIKRIKLKSLKNTRDLGGICTSDGKTIKNNLLIRSGHLGNASDEDISILCKKHNLGIVVDFRIDAEIKEHPDNLCNAVQYIRLPLLEKSYLGITRDEYSLYSWFNLFDDKTRTPDDIFYDMYDFLVFGDRARELIPQFFNILLESKGKAVLWHCSAGKDRVGITTMLLLLALGVDKDTIIDDFMATNKFTKNAILKTRIFSPLVIKERWKRKCLDVLMTVKPMYLERIFEKVEREYQSVEDFFEKQYGINRDTIIQLKKMYLN